MARDITESLIDAIRAWANAPAAAANRLGYFTDEDTIAFTTLSAFMRTVLDDLDGPTALGTLGAQPLDADLTAIAALTTQAFGRSLLEQSSAAAVRELIGSARILYTLTAADMNSTADQIFTKVGTFTNYFISFIRTTNASISLTTAQGGIYLAAGKTTPIVGNTQSYSTLTGSDLGVDMTIQARGRGVRTETPILSLTTAQGAAATADFYIFGLPV